MKKLKVMLLCAALVNGGIAMAQDSATPTNADFSIARTTASNSGPAKRNSRTQGTNSNTQKSGKSGYTVLAKHPNERSGLNKIRRKRRVPQAGNGGLNGRKKRTKGFRKGKYANCEAYM